LASDLAIIVPARLASTRFPRKLLHEIGGKPLILLTAERIRDQVPDLPLVFAVDGPELATPLVRAGFTAVETAPDLPSGTDRVAAVNAQLGARIVINVQADEPMVTAGQIRQLVGLIGQGADLATLGAPLEHERDYLDPNCVKCIPDRQGRALWFTRAPVPWFRDRDGRFDAEAAREVPVLLHLGLYAYTATFLARIVALPEGRLERIERLEMLRAMEHGYPIRVGVTHEGHVGIDTLEQAEDFAARLTSAPAEGSRHSRHP
jgi:3-deoxy-manno-octulosonate cytidylyltransferase (CMP-KDO synthetase)